MMREIDQYPYIQSMECYYLSQDMPLFLPSNEPGALVDAYLSDNTEDEMTGLLKDMEQFEHDYPGNMTEAFIKVFNSDIKIEDVQALFDEFRTKIKAHLLEQRSSSSQP